MMTRRTNTSPPYDADHDRRDDSRKPDAIKGLWYRRLKLSEVLAGFILAGLLLAATGWRYYSVTDLESRVARMEATQQRILDVLCLDHQSARTCQERE